MALKNCRECKKKISTEVLTCPNCGVPNPTKNFSKMKESEFILAERKQNADRAKLINDYYKDNKTSGVKDTFTRLQDGELDLPTAFWGFGVVGTIFKIPLPSTAI